MMQKRPIKLFQGDVWSQHLQPKTASSQTSECKVLSGDLLRAVQLPSLPLRHFTPLIHSVADFYLCMF